jgi:hypothetical protein
VISIPVLPNFTVCKAASFCMYQVLAFAETCNLIPKKAPR